MYLLTEIKELVETYKSQNDYISEDKLIIELLENTIITCEKIKHTIYMNNFMRKAYSKNYGDE